MSGNVAKVHISLVDGVLQIEGSEAFVSEQLAKLEPHIVKAFENRASTPKDSKKSVGKDGSGEASIQNYEHLFAESGGKVQILKNIPGNNNAQKSINITLLLAYAYSLIGSNSISTATIRECCKAHACLDSSNFSSTIKDENSLFILEGTSKAKNVKLTIPGRKKAEELASQLNV